MNCLIFSCFRLIVFWWFGCCWCCYIKFMINLRLSHWVDEKLFSRCRLPSFRMFVYVLLKFDWLIIFFQENLPRKFKILNFFFLSSFSARVLKCHDCAWSVVKSGGIFCPSVNFNWMDFNESRLNKMIDWLIETNSFLIGWQETIKFQSIISINSR